LYLNNPRLRAALQQRTVFLPPKSDGGANIRGLDVGAVRARRAFVDLPLDHLFLPDGSGKRPKLILVGFGEMGQSLAFQAAQLDHFPSGGLLQIMVVDERATERVKEFEADYPNLAKVAEILPIPGALEDPDIRQRLREEHKTASQNGELVACALCYDQADVRNLSLGLDLVRDLPESKTPAPPVLVYLATKSGLAQLLPAEKPQTPNQRLAAFGMIEDIWTFDKLKDDRQDKLARAFHEAYCQCQQTRRAEAETLSQRPAEKPWEQLDETYRQANRAAADHLPFKLLALGWKMCPLSEPGAQSLPTFDDSQKELLAKMEHARWCAERWLSGWTTGLRNNELKQHPLLVSWDDLPLAERRIDNDMINIILQVLEDLKYGVKPIGSRKD
jgi:hypothetical protein